VAEPWHYTTFVDFLDHWQALMAGLLGFAAAIVVVRITLQIERRKADHELDALRKSLGVELRVVIRNALVAYNALMDRVKNNMETTGQVLPYATTLAIPIVYPANAGKIGFLGSDAMRMVAIYGLLDIARGAVTSLARMPAAKIPSKTLVNIAEPLLRACEQSIPMLKQFQVADPAYDEIDNTLINAINTALREAASAPHPTTGAEQKATS
jgi:hypothetical protein